MILVIDSPYLGHIARFSHGSLDNGVVFGFLRQVLTLARRFNTDRFVFAWDSQKSHRRILFNFEYKANRHKDLTEEEKQDLQSTYEQFTILRKEVLPRIGFKNIFMQTGKESDDLIATIVHKTEVDEKIVVSSDNDLYQLLNFCGLYNLRTKTLYMKEDLKNEYGIAPIDWIHVKAIAGCVSDNIKGLNGIGEKTAAKFLRTELGKNTKAWKTITAPENQLTIKDNFRLVQLPMEGTKEIRLTKEDFQDEFDLDAFVGVCELYGFRSFLRDLSSWIDIFSRKKERNTL